MSKSSQTSHAREQLESWVGCWLEANRTAERVGDWKPLADFYEDDATYGWNIGPKEDVMCVGIDEIRDIALGLEMEGLENWQYPYQKVIIDDKQGEIVGFWKQIVADSDDTQSAIYGLEMEGLENWQYPYQKVIIDDKQGEIVGFWKQIVADSDDTQSEIYGIGGSWFRLNADAKIEWERDFLYRER